MFSKEDIGFVGVSSEGNSEANNNSMVVRGVGGVLLLSDHAS